MSKHHRKHRRLLDALHNHANPHRRVHQALIGIALSGSLIFFGACLATTHQETVPAFIWDGLAYSIHGIGLVPLCVRAEALWALFFGAE